MDERYYMLGGLALAVLVLFVYAVAAIVRYRRALGRARRDAAESARLAAQASYLGAAAEHADDIFAVRRTGAPGVVGVAVADAAVPGAAAVPPPVADAAPADVASAEAAGAEAVAAATVAEVEPVPLIAAGPLAAPGGKKSRKRRVTDADIPKVHREAPEPEPAPEPAPEPGVAPEPVPEPAPEAVPEFASEPIPETAPATGLEHAPDAAPEAFVAPDAGEVPVPLPAAGGLAAELERLMSAAEVAPPLLTPEEHDEAASAPAPPLPEPEKAVLPTVFPQPSVGQVLSTAAGAFVDSGASQAATDVTATPGATLGAIDADTSGGESAPAASVTEQMADTVTPAAEVAHLAEPPSAAVSDGAPPEYRLVAPVELHFTSGSRVGVKSGTRAHAEFQRLAAILLDDLRDASGR